MYLKAKLELFPQSDILLGVAGGKGWAESVRREGRGKRREQGGGGA